MRKYIVFVILISAINFFPAHTLLAQGLKVNTDTSKIVSGAQSYAMIIGISTYMHIRPLSYADSDAGIFKDYLKSAGAGSLADDHILYLINEDATAANFWVKGMAWLRQKNLKNGDRLYIYLAGHGDAINQDEYFFLTYDCNPAGDKNNYIVTGSIQLYNLKSRIAELSRKNVEVFLIMDACRTNELPGGTDGQQILNSAVSERKAGEIIMLATGAGQESMEDPNIGNGHGLFTYYLVDGLSGWADGYETKDGIISLKELHAYILAKVPTLAVEKYKKKQEPFICCEEKGQRPIGIVDSVFFKQWEMGKNLSGMSDGGGVNNLINNIKGRGALFADSNVVLIYNNFTRSIKRQELTGDNSADYFYEVLKKLYPDDALTFDARQTLAAEFINFAQRKINLYLSGKDALAIQQIRTQLDESQASEEITAGIERLEYIAGLDFEKVATMMQKVINLIDPADSMLIKNLKGKYFFFKARSFFNEKEKASNIKEAKDFIYQSYTLDSNAAYILHTIASLQLQLKRPDSSIYYSLKAISKAPKWRYPYTTIAFANAQIKRFDLAKVYYEKAIAIDPKSADALVDLGYFEFQQGRTEKAQEYYLKALALDPGNVSALNNMGWVMKEKGNYNLSITYFMNCIKNDSSFFYAYNGLAKAYGGLKMYDTARFYFLKSIHYYTDQAYVYNLMGNFFIEIKHTDSAIHYYHQAVQLDSNYMQPYLNLARYFEQNKRIDSAAYYYRKIIHVSPNSKKSYLSLASFFQNTRSNDSAMIYFNKAIAIDPENAVTYNTIAVNYFKRNQQDSAKKYFKKASSLDTGNVNYLTNLAAVYEKLKQNDSALYTLQKAVLLSPGNAKIYNSIALLFKKQNKFDSSLLFYKLAYQFNNESLAVLNDLSDLYRDMSEFDSSFKFLREAINLQPGIPDLYNSIAVVFINAGLYDSAVHYLSAATKLDSTLYRAFNNLGNLYYMQNKYPEAILFYIKALEIDSTYENPLLFIGLSYVNMGVYSKGAVYLERLLKENPKNATAYYYLAICYASLNNESGAMKNLEEALKLHFTEADIIMNQKEFSTLKNKSSFKTLMKKYFPNGKF